MALKSCAREELGAGCMKMGLNEIGNEVLIICVLTIFLCVDNKIPDDTPYRNDSKILVLKYFDSK